MKVVNIVPMDLVDTAKDKMFVAIDWSLQRWNEEGRHSDDNIEEGDGDDELEEDIDREMEAGVPDEEDTYDEEEDEEEDDEDDDEEDLGELGLDDEEPRVHEHEEEDEEDDIHTPAPDPVQELGEYSGEEEEVDDEPHGRTPVGAPHDVELDTLSHGRAPVGAPQDVEGDTRSHGRTPVGAAQDVEGDTLSHARTPVGAAQDMEGGDRHDGDEAGGVQSDRSLVRPVSPFTSGFPPTPGRGFRHDDVIPTSEEREDHRTEPQEAQQSAQEVQQEGVQPLRFTSKPAARKKVKATRKGRKSLHQPLGGEASCSLEDSAPTSGDVEGDSGEVVADEDHNIDDVPIVDTQSQNVEPLLAGLERSDYEHAEGGRVDLNVSSPVEEVTAVVLQVMEQGRSNVDATGVLVEVEPAVASPSKDEEIVIRTEVICLDSDDEVPERRVELDVRVKVKDKVPYRVRGTFADYMTDDSEDEDYGKIGYSRVKLDFVDDPHPVFGGRSQPIANDKEKGKESDLKDKVHFAPFVDKYLSEVPENVRLNLAHMYKSYDYHKMFAYLSTPAFCEAVKVKHILHAASLKKMRKRWTAFDAPPERHGRDHYQGSTAAQARSVVDSTLEIIDISGVQESPSRDANVGAAETSSAHGVPPNPPATNPHPQGTLVNCLLALLFVYSVFNVIPTGVRPWERFHFRMWY
jgi:hypothetical protein